MTAPADPPAADLAATAEALLQARTSGDIPPSRHLVEWPSIGALLQHRAAAIEAGEFLVHYDEDDQRSTLSYRDLARRAGRLATLLARRHGVTRGDRVAALSVNHPDTVVLYFACWLLGATVAPQNPAEDDERIAFVLENAGCRLAFAHPDLADRLQAIGPRVAGLRAIVVLDRDLADAAAAQDVYACSAAVDLRDQEGLLVYTSGTTGAPKGVQLTQYNLMVDALGTSRALGVDRATRMMCVLPIHHVNGIVVTLVTPLVAGASVLLERAFRVGVFWARIAAESVALVSVVPTILQYLCEAAEQRPAQPCPSLRHVVVGAGTLTVALALRFEERFGVPLLHGYGLSETTAFACMLPRDLSADVHRGWLADHGYPSIGTAFWPNRIDVVDDAGRTVAEGERGEIVIRGHAVMSGYFARPDANREAFRGGWFHSGDEGIYRSDPSGRRFLFITGRIKELVNRGGVKYSPFDIEEVLVAIPGVKAAVVVAFDNDWYGEEIGAYVVPERAGGLHADDLLARCRERLPFSKSPKVVVFGQDIPVTATGKYKRLELKPLFEAHRATQFREPR